MDHQLKLTARGHAVCEAMADRGLSLDAACAWVERELETLRQTLERITSEGSPAQITNALELALGGVSVRVQSVYLEELELADAEASANPGWQAGAAVH